MERKEMTIRGDYRQDGTFIGFDYASQCWIDTGSTERDTSAKPGSASNPLHELPADRRQCQSAQFLIS